MHKRLYQYIYIYIHIGCAKSEVRVCVKKPLHNYTQRYGFQILALVYNNKCKSAFICTEISILAVQARRCVFVCLDKTKAVHP